MFHYHVRTEQELIILISIDNIPTLYQNKCNKNNRINYLSTEFRYLYSGVYRCESNVNIFWITKNAFNLWDFLCLISPVEFCGLALVDTRRFSKITWSLDWQVAWKNRWDPFTLTHSPSMSNGHWRCEIFCKYNVITW